MKYHLEIQMKIISIQIKYMGLRGKAEAGDTDLRVTDTESKVTVIDKIN